MRKLSNPRLAALILPPLWLSLAAGSCGQGPGVQTFPPPVDLKEVTEPQPKPTPEIVTDPQANERYNAAVEMHGIGVLSAGIRICEWAKEVGMKLDFACRR
jgi:hypothetical protein